MDWDTLPEWARDYLRSDPRAITFRQPAEALIVAGHKRVENRTTKWHPDTIRDRWVALHAGKKKSDHGTFRPTIEALIDDPPCSVIRAIDQLKDIVTHSESTVAEFGEYATGPYCITIRHLYVLHKPLTGIGGHLNFWKLLPQTVHALAHSIVHHGVTALY